METPDDYDLLAPLKASLGQQPLAVKPATRTCVNCKHWSPHGPSAFKLCFRLFNAGDDQTSGTLYTAPDFGCTLFEEK